MALPNIKKIRTDAGDLLIDYNALDNLPTSDTTLNISGAFADAATVGNEISRLDTSISDGISSINSEITRLDGLIGDTDASIPEQITSAMSSKQDIITGAATTIIDQDLEAKMALVSNSSGKITTSSVTSQELYYLCGTTSNIQTQLDTKVQKSTTIALLPVDGWNSNQQTVSVSGVTASNTIIVTPDPTSYEHYNECMVRCSEQADGALTFTCTDTPTSALTANVLILN